MQSRCKFTLLQNIINDACIKLGISEDILSRCEVVSPSAKFAENFDFTANHAMVIASQIKTNPQDLASKIISRINNLEIVNQIKHIEVTGAFINIKMKPEFWHDVILLSSQDSKYAFSNYSNNEKVNVEYVSANPTGPMHIGHARGAVYGDVVCNILSKCGYNVTREYYINDAGSQISKVMQSVMFRVGQIIENNFSQSPPEGCYPGEYLIEIAKNVVRNFGNVSQEYNDDKVRDFVLSEIMQVIKSDLAKLGVKHDVFTSEKAITDKGEVEKAVELLTEKGLIYKGTIEKPKGKEMEDWEPSEQMLFKSSLYGDDTDRPIKKSDGSWAYFTPDIAYHYNKYTRGFNKMVLVLGADHKGYKKRISAAVRAISDEKASIDVILCELVNFVKNGEPIKMSKRAGNFLTLSDVLAEIDPQILRFFLLTKKNDTVVDFDFDKVLEQSKENPIFYIQYAHSRCCSLLRKAAENGITLDEGVDYPSYIHHITHPAQMEVCVKIARYPRLIKHVCKTLEPHLISSYLIDLVSSFHALWNVSDFRFISDNKDKTISNLIFVTSVKNTIASALDCFGVKALESM